MYGGGRINAAEGCDPKCRVFKDCQLDCPDGGELKRNEGLLTVWCERSGEKHGRWMKWYKNGQIRMQMSYNNGEAQGKRCMWHKSGQKAAEINLVDGKAHGRMTVWDEDGTKGDERCFNAGTQVPCEGKTWTDKKAKLTWQVSPTGKDLDWDEAAAHCAGVYTTGTPWRLPTIGELRSLIRGCPKTERGGECKVDEGCLKSECMALKSCNFCGSHEGPARGCYWPDELKGECGEYWSASAIVGGGDGENAWEVNFYTGALYSISGPEPRVRCVRDAP